VTEVILDGSQPRSRVLDQKHVTRKSRPDEWTAAGLRHGSIYPKTVLYVTAIVSPELPNLQEDRTRRMGTRVQPPLRYTGVTRVY